MKFRMLMNVADDLLGGGGGTPPAKDDNAAPPAKDDKGGAGKPWYPENWKDLLPDDIKNDPSIKSLKDPEALAKSYIHGQKLIGKDKIIVPDASYSDEQWNEVFKKLGLPESPDKYEVKAPDDVDPEFMKTFKEFAVKNGVLPRQGEKFLSFMHEYGTKAVQAQEANAKATFEKSVNSLKQEWGQAYETKLSKASQAYKEFADPETQKAFKEMGLSNDPAFIKLFAKVADAFGEGKFVAPGGNGQMGMTPQEADQKITAIYAAYPNHPYFDKNNAGHAKAREEMAKLQAAKLGKR